MEGGLKGRKCASLKVPPRWILLRNPSPVGRVTGLWLGVDVRPTPTPPRIFHPTPFPRFTLPQNCIPWGYLHVQSSLSPPSGRAPYLICTPTPRATPRRRFRWQTNPSPVLVPRLGSGRGRRLPPIRRHPAKRNPSAAGPSEGPPSYWWRASRGSPRPTYLALAAACQTAPRDTHDDPHLVPPKWQRLREDWFGVRWEYKYSCPSSIKRSLRRSLPSR